MNNARLPNPSNVGGASGFENVKNMWLHHYQSLLNLYLALQPTSRRLMNTVAMYSLIFK